MNDKTDICRYTLHYQSTAQQRNHRQYTLPQLNNSQSVVADLYHWAKFNMTSSTKLIIRSMASTVFNLRPDSLFSTISLQVIFGLPLGLAPATSYSIHLFIKSLSSFHNTCPYHRNLLPLAASINVLDWYCEMAQADSSTCFSVPMTARTGKLCKNCVSWQKLHRFTN